MFSNYTENTIIMSQLLILISYSWAKQPTAFHIYAQSTPSMNVSNFRLSQLNPLSCLCTLNHKLQSCDQVEVFRALLFIEGTMDILYTEHEHGKYSYTF